MATNSLKIIAGRYLLQHAIQSGGMTTVYQARDLKLDTLVAIKRFDRDRHLPEIEREAFLREVDALENLSHPHIVRMLDSGEDETGRFYLVLELMKHDLLQERDANGQAFAGWDDFAELVVLPLLDALAYAHEMGIAHRDVKPANVLVSPDGLVKLADFGISKLKRTLQPRLTLNEFMSPPFCPPELDDGSQTYARDVYAIGVLCLWAMSSDHISEYADVENALEEFDAPPEIIPIIARTVSLDASKRPQSAALLSTEVTRVHNQRRRHWVVSDRRCCVLGMTKTSIAIAKEELGTGDENAIRRFITEDINSEVSTVQRVIDRPGTMDERINYDHYFVLGSAFRYRIARGSRGYDSFALVSITKLDPHYLQRDHSNTPPSPLTFVLGARLGSISHAEAIEILERTLEAFAAQRKEEERLNRETALFDAWQQVLDAKLQYERDQSKPIVFSNSIVDGTLVTLITDSALGVELGQSRVIYGEDSRFIRGEVWEIQSGQVILNCPGAPLHDMPKYGEAKLDQYALEVAVARQRDAIDRIRLGTCARSALKGLILEPLRSEPPSGDHKLSRGIRDMLDESKCEAIIAALLSRDILLVEGPPGTGKTSFIAGLIVEERLRNPKARILLSSQTHIAIDNALERLAKNTSDLPMVRIAREQSNVIGRASLPYLLNRQMRVWRDEVVMQASAGLEKWAKANGLNPNEVRTGAIMRQLAAVRERVERTRERIEEEEQRRASLAGLKSSMQPLELQLEMERVLLDLQELRDQLESDKIQNSKLQEALKGAHKEAADLLTMSIPEQGEWAEAFLGGAARLIRLQSEWMDRFGTGKGFVRPLIERSAIVAATCVGLSSIDEVNDVEFDLCIIDESSKATAMESCVPMARAHRWVLVGDSKQLPPFQEEVLARPNLREEYSIESPEASESLFERFRRLLPDTNKVMLKTQYRMVQPIGRMISDCFYDGTLKNIRTEIDKDLCGVTGYAVNWMSTRRLADKTEQLAGTSYVNSSEASRICDLLIRTDYQLRNGKAKRYSVLVLSGYAAQVHHLERRITQIRHQLRYLEIECCTIDRVQGREADAVFFSLTRSNAERTVGFLRALERMNVALSRARNLLFIVGDDDFVERASEAEPMQRVLSHIRRWPSECFLGAFDPQRVSMSEGRRVN